LVNLGLRGERGDLTNKNQYNRIMADSFKIEDGEISIETDKIKISDKSKKQNLMTMINSIIWVFFGLVTIIRYFTKGDEFALWTGSLIGIGHFVVLIIYLFRSHQAGIHFDEIKSIKVKERIGRKFLDIKLKNHKLRRVIGVHNKEKLQEYLKAHVPLRVD
jgi:hypothetical protein